jgi:hypothetical protein
MRNEMVLRKLDAYKKGDHTTSCITFAGPLPWWFDRRVLI